MIYEKDYFCSINLITERYEVIFQSFITIPEVIGLNVRNYPNPFNPITTIEFSVRNTLTQPSPQERANNYSLSLGEGRGEGIQSVTIDIFNIKGQKIRSLVNDFYPVGHHSVVWNGTDDNGRNMGSGIYLYRVIAGDETATRKMVLIK